MGEVHAALHPLKQEVVGNIGSVLSVAMAKVQKAPMLTDDIRAVVAATDTGTIGARDRALILLGFAGAFAGLNWSLSISRIADLARMA